MTETGARDQQPSEERRQEQKSFFTDLRNLYKTTICVGDSIKSENVEHVIKQIAIERITSGYPGARIAVLSISKGPATIDHLSYTFQKARYHPLRDRTVESDFPIPVDIAEKLTFVDCDSSEEPFTGFVLMIAHYYKDAINPKSISEAIKIKPDHIAMMIIPIDNDPTEFRMIGYSVLFESEEIEEYCAVMLTNWLLK